MRFLSWLRLGNRFQGHARGRGCGAPRQRATFRPRLEALEARDVPSTLKVTNNLDYGPGSLRYEISHANAGDTIVFDKSAGGTITLYSGELVIDKSLTIKGRGETITSQSYENFILENLPGSRIFEVAAGTTVAISGLTLSGGGGTRYGNGGVPAALNDGYGGAILNFGTLTLSGCTLGGPSVTPPVLQYNQAQYGGAIANFGTMTVSSCYVLGNFADYGGGIYNAGTLTVSNTYFSGNSPDAIFGPYTDGRHNTGL
jgi:hypothetical protein